MTDPIKSVETEIKSLVSDFQAKAGHPFLSRKLLITIAITAILIWIGLSEISHLLDLLAYLALMYLATQGINDGIDRLCKSRDNESNNKVRIAVIQALAKSKEGFDENDISKV